VLIHTLHKSREDAQTVCTEVGWVKVRP